MLICHAPLTTRKIGVFGAPSGRVSARSPRPREAGAASDNDAAHSSWRQACCQRQCRDGDGTDVLGDDDAGASGDAGCAADAGFGTERPRGGDKDVQGTASGVD